MVRIDFETRSQLDVTEVGAHVYSKHPSTDVLCLCWAVDDGPVHLWHPFGNDRCMPKELRRKLLYERESVEAHNKMFEECIWQNVMVKKYNWPEIFVEQWHCSAAGAAAMALPRKLQTLGKALKLKKQKDMEGNRVMLRCSKPRKPTKTDPYSKWHEEPQDLNRVFSYCGDDVECERETSETVLPLSPFEREVWLMDQRINRRGVFIDKEGVEAALFLMQEYRIELCQELADITEGAVNSPSELKKIHNFLEEKRVFLPNLQAQTVSDFLESKVSDLDPAAIRILEIRSRLSKSSTTKYQSMLDRLGDDCRVRDILIYCGASTGRFAGSGIQIQNLPAGRSITDKDLAIEVIKLRDLELLKMLYPDPLTVISAVIRGMIHAPPGKILRSIDYNAIEARVIFWLAGCWQGVNEFRENLPIYKLMAGEVFGVHVDNVTEEQRDLGKRIVLGSGFGMGWKKFVITCKQQANKIIEPALAQKGINAYRTRYKEVPKFWANLDQAAIEVVSKGVGAKKRVGKILFTMHEKYLTATLPSGRDLYYWYPSIKTQTMDWGSRESVHFWFVDSQTKQWVEGSSYGGLWAENVTQAVARDVMVVAMLAVEKAGHAPIFSVHDEIVLEDDLKFSSLSNVEKIMLDSLPVWADGLPIVVKGWEGPRYKK